MRILFLSDHFRPEPSAPAAHVYERSRYWVQWGHEVTVVTGAPNLPDGKVYAGYRNHWRFVEDMDGVRVLRVKTFITRNDGFVLRSLDYASSVPSSVFFSLFERRPDVVITTSPHMFMPIAGIWIARAKRVPHVLEVRDMWPASILATSNIKPGRAYRMLQRLERYNYRQSSRIISLTHSFVDDIAACGVPREKIHVVINGANLELFSPRPPDPEIVRRFGLEGRFVVGYLGTLGAPHALENVVCTAELLRGTHITFFFVGVGAARERLEAMVRDRGLPNVLFAGRQPKEEMPRFWSVCHASLVHLRDAELFRTVIPSKIFEAMAVGLPTIFVGPRGEGAGIVERHDTGVVVPPENPQALAEAVCALAADGERRRRLAANSLAAAPLYSREKHAKDTLAVLEKAVGERSRSTGLPSAP